MEGASLAPPPTAQFTPVEIERRRRIKVSVWAYAYQVLNESIVDDATFDAECRLINPNMDTGNAELDAFFRSEFAAHTGMWVERHPHQDRLRRLATERLSERKKQRGSGKRISVRTRNEKETGGMLVK